MSRYCNKVITIYNNETMIECMLTIFKDNLNLNVFHITSKNKPVII